MDIKIIIYIIVTGLVFYAMDAININQIFKQNRVLQARIFYMLIGISLIYLTTNFIYDFFIISTF